MIWQDKVILLQNERIRLGQRREKGNLGQTEILSFEIVNQNNEVIGRGEYTEHTQINGLRNSFILEYSKSDGTRCSERW